MPEQDLPEEGEVKYIMSLSKDKKKFRIDLVSTASMTESMVVRALENYLYDNILEGRWPFDKANEQ